MVAPPVGPASIEPPPGGGESRVSGLTTQASYVAVRDRPACRVLDLRTPEHLRGSQRTRASIGPPGSTDLRHAVAKAPVDEDRRAGDVGRLHRAQVDGGRGDLLDAAEPFDRQALARSRLGGLRRPG